jgi:energy-coupling factor transporter ATP-binding protein EcfA2
MTDTRQPAAVVTGVRKSFGETVVLDDVDLTVTEGTIFALLGPNGAGKTTMVRILSPLIPADSGHVQVAGHDIVADPVGVRFSIGATGQFSAVDELLTGTESLQLMADLNHLGRVASRAHVDDLLDRFGLVDAAGRRSPPSTSTKPTSLRIGSPSSTTAASSPRARPTTSNDAFPAATSAEGSSSARAAATTGRVPGHGGLSQRFRRRGRRRRDRVPDAGVLRHGGSSVRCQTRRVVEQLPASARA